MTITNDEIVLDLIQAYVVRRTWLDILCRETRETDSNYKHDIIETSKAIREIYNNLNSWINGNEIDKSIIGKFSLHNSYLKDNGVLIALRKLIAAQNELDILSEKNDIDNYIDQLQPILRNIHKYLVLLNLWSLGEDLTYHSMQFD